MDGRRFSRSTLTALKFFLPTLALLSLIEPLDASAAVLVGSCPSGVLYVEPSPPNNIGTMVCSLVNTSPDPVLITGTGGGGFVFGPDLSDNPTGLEIIGVFGIVVPPGVPFPVTVVFTIPNEIDDDPVDYGVTTFTPAFDGVDVTDGSFASGQYNGGAIYVEDTGGTLDPSKLPPPDKPPPTGTIGSRDDLDTFLNSISNQGGFVFPVPEPPAWTILATATILLCGVRIRMAQTKDPQP